MAVAEKRYTVDKRENLFSKDYEKVSESTWNVFPTNRIVVDYVEYSWTYKDKDKKNVEYAWNKIEVTNFKLTYEDWLVVKKKKVVWNRAVDEKTSVSMTKEQFQDMINWISEND